VTWRDVVSMITGLPGLIVLALNLYTHPEDIRFILIMIIVVGVWLIWVLRDAQKYLDGE